MMLKLKVPPPIYMLLMAVLMWGLDKYFPIHDLESSLGVKLGVLLIITALIVDLKSLLQFFRGHTTINPIHPEKSRTLITTGMYQYSRNPMYLGLLFLLTGWGFILASASPLIMLPVFVVIITRQQILPEEQVLEQKFGQQYRDYKKSVKRWL